MTAPDLIRPLLSEYLDGELSAADAERVAAHLPGCPDCAAELAQMRAASQALRAARTEPAATALHSVRAQFRSALAERASGGGWTFRLLPQLAAAGMAAVLLIAAGAIMIPRMSHHESQQAKNSVVYIRPEESGLALDAKAAPAAAPAAAASAPAPASLASAAPAAPPSLAAAGEQRADRAGNFAPAPPAQSPKPSAVAGVASAAADEEKKAKRETEQNLGALHEAAAEKKRADGPARDRAAVASAHDETRAEGGREQDAPADRTARYAVMPKVAIATLWVRGAGGDAAAPVTRDPRAAAGAGKGDDTLAQAPASSAAPAAKAAPAPAGAPPSSEPGLARRADCHPAAPEFPAFPGLHAGDADRLPLTVAVTIDGGGHVVAVEPRAGPAQMPLALEIRNWLRGQRVRPMICNGEGVSATLTLTFTWPGD